MGMWLRQLSWCAPLGDSEGRPASAWRCGPHPSWVGDEVSHGAPWISIFSMGNGGFFNDRIYHKWWMMMIQNHPKKSWNLVIYGILNSDSCFTCRHLFGGCHDDKINLPCLSTRGSIHVTMGFKAGLTNRKWTSKHGHLTIKIWIYLIWFNGTVYNYCINEI